MPREENKEVYATAIDRQDPFPSLPYQRPYHAIISVSISIEECSSTKQEIMRSKEEVNK
jgi:hypothetical protein